MEDRCANTHTQLRGIQEKAYKAQRFLSCCVSAVMVMWSQGYKFLTDSRPVAEFIDP
jgi:hypothetical protein